MRRFASFFATVLLTAPTSCGSAAAKRVRSQETDGVARKPFVASETCADAEARRAVTLINAVRAQSQLGAVVCDEALAVMAMNHARYLAANTARATGDRHAEEKGLPLYTGTTLRERAAAAGVEHEAYWLSENVGGDGTSSHAAVYAHLATVFHRSPLLTPGAVALAYATASSNDPAPPPSFRPAVIVRTDATAGPLSKPLTEGRKDEGADGLAWAPPPVVVMTSLALADAPTSLPVALHPAPGAADVPASFSVLRENPDPVPDLAAPGYPISVHFPRHRLPRGDEPALTVESFALTRAGAPVPARLLTPATDARLFGSDAYLVPLAPLVAGRYEVQVAARYGKARVATTWSFTVADR